MAMDSLWGDEFVIPETPKKTKTVAKLCFKPKIPRPITTERMVVTIG